jgi:hypothetical protein
MRDALLLLVFQDAVRHGDPGIVLMVIKIWIYTFRGAGLVNYARECVNTILTWHYELSPELQEAMEHAWFYNRFGHPDGCIPTDLYLEFMNFWFKVYIFLTILY